jgi:hypothetical protein
MGKHRLAVLKVRLRWTCIGYRSLRLRVLRDSVVIIRAERILSAHVPLSAKDFLRGTGHVDMMVRAPFQFEIAADQVVQ